MFCRLTSLTLVALLLLGCASLPRQVPAYPSQGQTPPQIQTDIAECTTWAQYATEEPGRAAVIGAVGGAVILAGIGAAFGAVLYALLHLDPGDGAVMGASLGGIMGAAEGAGASVESAAARRRGAYAACMTSHGYTVAVAP